MATTLAEITRGSLVESVHEGNVAVVDAEGSLVAFGGDPGAHSYFRSAAKPFQAVPLVASGAADAFGFTSEELALATASHNATDRHQDIVSSMLRKAGLGESDRKCGFSPPLDAVVKARITLRLERPNQIVCECSGEHAGMLAACRHLGWPIQDYTGTGHPLQIEVQRIVAAACGLPASDLAMATDGCSLPTFGAPLYAFASGYAVLSDPDGARWEGENAWRLALTRMRAAMTTHPELISGEGEIDTIIMQLTHGRVVAKLGAEGLLCLASPCHRLGVAISDAGGSPRGLGPAAVAVMEELGIVDGATLERLHDALCPPVESFSGQVVGETRPALRLDQT